MDFPTEAYTQGERFQIEKRRLFARLWLPLCAAGQIAEAGQFVNHTLGGWPIFAIRGADGVARAFRNVCKHQGMPVLEKPSGQCDVLRCRYHGWTYDQTGALIAAPPQMAPEDPAAAMNHLDALELTEADGVLFVRGRPPVDAPPPSLAPGDRAYRAAVTTDIDANWKTVVEALLPDARWRLAWPIALVGDDGAVRIVRQVVPRTFTRTRLVDLLFTADDPGDAADRTRADAQQAKHAAEALQQRYAGGDTTARAPAVQAFRERLAEACAGG
jgi:nitrite reductase/ring-hydroxylating ferredoxin subunit